MKLKTFLLKYDKLFDHRNIVTTIVLYGVFLSAIFFVILSSFDIVDLFVEFAAKPYRYWLYNGTEDTFFAWVSCNYGKGWIPGWLISIVAGICNYRLIQGHRDGVCWMLILFYVICFPTIFVELEEFICFSFSTMAAVIVYSAFLFLPKKRTTYWKECKPSTNWLTITAVVFTIIWAFMLISSCHNFKLYQALLNS